MPSLHSLRGGICFFPVGSKGFTPREELAKPDPETASVSSPVWRIDGKIGPPPPPGCKRPPFPPLLCCWNGGGNVKSRGLLQTPISCCFRDTFFPTDSRPTIPATPLKMVLFSSPGTINTFGSFLHGPGSSLIH